MLSKRGFTLIELLVVIAIIGLLASIVLVSFPTATKKANDSRVIAAMSQIRSKEMALRTAGDAYITDCANAEIKVLCDDIKAKNNGGANPTIQASGDNLCAYTTLNTQKSGATQYYCLDATGVIGSTATNPNTTCTATAWACPSGTTQ